MRKLFSFGCILAFLFLFVRPQSELFSHYKRIEAYEIRPGILAMPTYSTEGEICEIELERRHYSNAMVNLNSGIPRDLTTQMADELAPPSERGPLAINLGREYLTLYAGGSGTTFADYQNVTIVIYGGGSPACNSGDIVALIHWKNRKCK